MTQSSSANPTETAFTNRWSAVAVAVMIVVGCLGGLSRVSVDETSATALTGPEIAGAIVGTRAGLEVAARGGD